MGAHGHGNEGGHPRPSKPRICLASLPGVLGDGHIIFIAITGILCPLPVEGGPSPHSLLSVFTQQALLFINEIGVKKYLNKSKTCASSSFFTPPHLVTSVAAVVYTLGSRLTILPVWHQLSLYSHLLYHHSCTHIVIFSTRFTANHSRNISAM